MKLYSIIKTVSISLCIALFFTGCEEKKDDSGSAGSGITLTAPSVVTASNGTLEDSVILEWEAVPGAEYYVIYKSLNDIDQFKVIASNVTEITYTDTPVSPGRIFYYRVAGAVGSAWGEPSAGVKGYAIKGTSTPPSSVTVPENKIGGITITWTASVNLDTTSYKIMRSEKKYGTYELLVELNTSDLTELSYTDTTALPDKKYYYQIIAINPNGESVPSDSISGIALKPVPGIPSGISATDGTYGEKVVITWTAADNATTYIVMRAPDSSGTPGEFTRIAEDITGEIYEDRSLVDGKIYHYTVIAASSGGESGLGTADAGSIDLNKPEMLNPPVNVRASKGKANMITVTWNQTIGAVKYTIYRSTESGGIYEKKGESDGLTFSYNDFPEETITKYYYRVTAWSISLSGSHEAMESEMSLAPAEGFANPEAPVIPAGVTVTMSHTAGTITLNWAASERADFYNVYSSDAEDGTYNLLSANQRELTYTDRAGETIETGTEYYYKVEAVNEGGKSDQSPSVGGILLSIPTGLAASKTLHLLQGKYTYTLTWNPVTAATGYEIVYDNSTTISIPGGSINTITFDIKSLAISHKFKIRAVYANEYLNVKGDFSAEITK